MTARFQCLILLLLARCSTVAAELPEDKAA